MKRPIAARAYRVSSCVSAMIPMFAIGRLLSPRGCGREVPLGEVEEVLPVGGDGGVAAAVVVEGEGAGGDGLVEGRQVGGAEVGLAEEFVDGAGGGEGEELAFGVAPLIAQAAVDIDGPRS